MQKFVSYIQILNQIIVMLNNKTKLKSFFPLLLKWLFISGIFAILLSLYAMCQIHKNYWGGAERPKEKQGTLYAHSSTQNLMKMLIADRLDYAIEIHSFANYIAKQIDNENVFETYAIDENKNKVLLAYIFCTKNEWGRKVIAKVDTILKEKRLTPEYVEIMGRWYDDKGRKIIKDYYHNNFLELK